MLERNFSSSAEGESNKENIFTENLPKIIESEIEDFCTTNNKDQKEVNNSLVSDNIEEKILLEDKPDDEPATNDIVNDIDNEPNSNYIPVVPEKTDVEETQIQNYEEKNEKIVFDKLDIENDEGKNEKIVVDKPDIEIAERKEKLESSKSDNDEIESTEKKKSGSREKGSKVSKKKYSSSSSSKDDKTKRKKQNNNDKGSKLKTNSKQRDKSDFNKENRINSKEKKKIKESSSSDESEKSTKIRPGTTKKQLNSFLCKDLTLYLKKNNLSVKGRKAELIDRVYKHLSS